MPVTARFRLASVLLAASLLVPATAASVSALDAGSHTPTADTLERRVNQAAVGGDIERSAAASREKLTRTDMRRVQRALNRLGYPKIEVTGKDSPLMRNVLCTFRESVGRAQTRAALTVGEAGRIRAMTRLPDAPKRLVVGLNVNRACQTTSLVAARSDGTKRYVRIFRVSTGKPGYETSVGTHRIHRRIDGLHNSTSYPSPIGWNMYRPAYFEYKGEAFHGNNSDSAVAWYPSSHGCVRMLQADMDWLWANGGVDIGQAVRVYGTWRG